MKQLSILVTGLLLLSGACQQKEEEQMQKTATMNNTIEHYTFELSDKVTRQKVTFKNRYGITLTGDLYLPKTAYQNIPKTDWLKPMTNRLNS